VGSRIGGSRIGGGPAMALGSALGGIDPNALKAGLRKKEEVVVEKKESSTEESASPMALPLLRKTGGSRIGGVAREPPPEKKEESSISPSAKLPNKSNLRKATSPDEKEKETLDSPKSPRLEALKNNSLSSQVPKGGGVKGVPLIPGGGCMLGSGDFKSRLKKTPSDLNSQDNSQKTEESPAQQDHPTENS